MDSSIRSEEANSIEEQIDETNSSERICSAEKGLPELEDSNFFGIDREPIHGTSIMQHFGVRNQEEKVDVDQPELCGKSAMVDGDNAASSCSQRDVLSLIDNVVRERIVLSLSPKSFDIPKVQFMVENHKVSSPGANVGFSNLSQRENESAVFLENDSKPLSCAVNATSNINGKQVKEENVEFPHNRNQITLGKINDSCMKEDAIQISLNEKTSYTINNAPTAGDVKSHYATDVENISAFHCKPLDNILTQLSREQLQDIAEVSNKSLVHEHDNFSNDFDSVVSSNMIQALENKIKHMQEIVVEKDVCLASLNMQLQHLQRKEISDTRDISKELSTSQESSSFITSPTEYRTLQKDCGYKLLDLHSEIMQRDDLIEKLTLSLQQSINIREQLQQQSEKLSSEVQQLRRQLSETLDAIKRPYWQNYQEGVGQRLSEIDIELVSESGDDLDRQFLTNAEENVSDSFRNPKERQQNVIYSKFDISQLDFPATEQIEQFQKYMSADEFGIFFMIQKKFDDLLSQEIEKLTTKHDSEMKATIEELKTDVLSRDAEVKRLRHLLANVRYGSTELDKVRQELATIHFQEMENLRTYFEKKCIDLEKHYSEEIFSLKSQRDSIDSNSDYSDKADDDCAHSFERPVRSKKHTHAEFHSSLLLKEITPNPLVLQGRIEIQNIQHKDKMESDPSDLDARKSYQEKIGDITSKYEETVKKLSEKLKIYESKYADDEFMALLSENTTDDHHWPPEIILLREKFTAKSQLEIAQLQIKHEEEISKLKNEFERHLTRKMKRNSTFDLSRDLDQIITERNNLRELSNTLRGLLHELVKCVNFSKSEINSSLLDQIVHKIHNPQELNLHQDISNREKNVPYADIFSISTEANQHIQSILETKNFLIPDTSAILSLIEDPSFVEFVTNENCDCEAFNLRDCLEKLKREANHLLKLSENIIKNRKSIEPLNLDVNDCEEDDGLKFVMNNAACKELATQSLTDNFLSNNFHPMEQPTHTHSLPVDAFNFLIYNGTYDTRHPAENEQMLELRNRLFKSESDRQKLQGELNATIQKNEELGHELIALRMQIEQLDSQRESTCQRYGTNYIRPAEMPNENSIKTLAHLQEKARNFLTTTCKPVSVTSTNLLQLIEDFCRESDKVLEEGKKHRDDLQSQVDAADKQLKATRKFLEDQAVERELERDEFIKEVDMLKSIIREKEKDRASLEHASKEAEQMEKCIKDYKQQIASLEGEKAKLELELKASIDKIFVLREIISELETQVESKSSNEHTLLVKLKDLQDSFDSENKAYVDLQNEFESLKAELSLNCARENVVSDTPFSILQQEKVFEGVLEQLTEVENALDKKAKNLESLHQRSFSNSCSGSRSEDISFPLPKLTKFQLNDRKQQENSTEYNIQYKLSALLDTLQRVTEKLVKHTCTEEAAIKKFSDLGANYRNIRITCSELQNERDELQQRMAEQQSRISTLQSKLDKQKQEADTIQRQGTSELMIKMHDMKNEIFNLKETLSSRDKQLTNLKNQLEQSKVIIDRQEAELSLGIQVDRTAWETLQAELKIKEEEIKKLKDKIKNDMINKLALPDLMETMLADKNDEIDHLKERLETIEWELKLSIEKSKNEAKFVEKHASHDGGEVRSSARTLSDIGSISEFDEPDVIRKAPYEHEASANFPMNKLNFRETLASSKDQQYAAVKVQNFPSSSCFQSFHGDASSSTALCLPRHLNLTDFTDNSQMNYSPTTKNAPYSDVNATGLNSSANNSEKNLKLCSLPQGVRVNFSSELNEKKELSTNLLEKCEKQAEQLHAFEKQLQMKYEQKSINSLSQENNSAQIKIEETVEKSNEYSQHVQLMSKLLQEKDKTISKQEKDFAIYKENEKLLKTEIENLQQEVHNLTSDSSLLEKANLRKELELVRAELSAKVLLYEKFMLDFEAMEIEINSLRSDINVGHSCKKKSQEMVLIKHFEEIKQNLIAEEKRRIELENCNIILVAELEKLRVQNSDPKPFSLDEITERVEKELNYSAQLDSNILTAIESEGEKNCSKQFRTNADKVMSRETLRQLEVLQRQLYVEEENHEEITRLLNEEKLRFQEIQQQDADIIKAMRLQLQTALDKEKELYNILDAERQKYEQLVRQVSTMQKGDNRKCSFLLKSTPGSPNKIPCSQKISEVDLDLSDRHKNETKLLKSQIEIEKERVVDLQTALEREKNRFEVELNERVEYTEKLKQELEKICQEKEQSEQKVQNLQERLTLAARDILCFGESVSVLRETETRQLSRQNYDHNEAINNTIGLHDLKLRNTILEKEVDLLNHTIHTLKYDLERCAERETKLTEALINAGVGTNVPEPFLPKLKEMNYILIENKNENNQMAETLLQMTVGRKDLQKKCEELESASRNITALTAKIKDFEEKVSHLFGKYLRVESHRKALVHQKRYLLIVLQTYQDNEIRALQLLNGYKIPKRVSFKSVALIVIAIQRMKFIVKRWQIGKKVTSKPVLNFLSPK